MSWKTRVIERNIEPYHKGNCTCTQFLEPLKSWKDIVQRHDTQDSLRASLRAISDMREDWTVDMFRCEDCGRYWAREDCGSPWLTKSFAFFYFVDTDDPETWLSEARWTPLKKRFNRKDADFVNLIAPRIQLNS